MTKRNSTYAFQRTHYVFKCTVFWDVMPCTVVYRYQCFSVTNIYISLSPALLPSTLTMKAAGYSKIVGVSVCQTLWHGMTSHHNVKLSLSSSTMPQTCMGKWRQVSCS